MPSTSIPESSGKPKLKITCLMDNSPGTLGKAEHGLSFLVEYRGTTLIFDTGKTGAFVENARLMGLDPGEASHLVLSHGHYDHGGGFRHLVEEAGFSGSFHAGSSVFDPKWSEEDPAPRYLGLDFDQAWLEAKGLAFHGIQASAGRTTVRELVPGMSLCAGFVQSHGLEQPNPRFVVDRPWGRVQDDFSDEVCLALERADGSLAVILGCAHPGPMNMVDSVAKALGRPVSAVFGGSHLVDADPKRLEASLAWLNDSAIRLAALGHCSGDTALAALKDRVPAWKPLYVGARFDVD